MVGGELQLGGVVTVVAGTAVTTAVWPLVAAAEPLLFEAIATTRRVDPASVPTVVYVAAAAPPSAPQLLPLESQRCHWYSNFSPFPSHDPGFAESVLPTCAVPLIVGGDVLVGGACPGAEAPAPATPGWITRTTTTRV